MIILAIGDFHIPDRADKVPEWIVKKIEKIKPNLILCTGDLTDEKILKWLKNLAEVKIVKGNMDYLDLPISEFVEVEGIKIMLFHGKGIEPRGHIPTLAKIAKDQNAKIIVTGHTHKAIVKEYDNVIIVNPGSATGCISGEGVKSKESFATIEIGNAIKICIHFKEGEECHEFGR